MTDRAAKDISVIDIAQLAAGSQGNGGTSPSGSGGGSPIAGSNFGG